MRQEREGSIRFERGTTGNSKMLNAVLARAAVGFDQVQHGGARGALHLIEEPSVASSCAPADLDDERIERETIAT